MAVFDVGRAYSRVDIYDLLDVPEEKQDGAWNRGYREWDGEMFIFATVGVGTTSGFDYPNALHPDDDLDRRGIVPLAPGADPGNPRCGPRDHPCVRPRVGPRPVRVFGRPPLRRAAR